MRTQHRKHPIFNLGDWLIIGTLLALLTVALCGCTTTTTQNPDGSQTVANKFDPAKTAAYIRQYVPAATRAALVKWPEYRKYVVDAKVVICALTDSGKVTPADLDAAVKSTGINEIDKPEIQNVLVTIYGAYSVLYGDAAVQAMSQNQRVATFIPILQALCGALDEGLNTQ